MKRHRTIAGIVIAPLVVPITIYVALAITFPTSGFSGGDIQFTSIIAGIIAYFVCISFGVPIHWFLKSCKQTSLLSYSFSGSIAGAISSLLAFGVLPGVLNDYIETAIVFGVLVIAGCLVGALFWLIGIKGV